MSPSVPVAKTAWNAAILRRTRCNARALLLVGMIPLAGCSSSRGEPRDAGASADGAGTGVVGDDGGAAPSDAARPELDTGTTQPDGGGPPPDAGGSIEDAATLPLDAGGPVPCTMDSGAPASSYAPTGYTLVFSDEFNEARLDTTKWWTRYVYNGGTLDHLNDEKELYRENNDHVLTGCSIKLMAYKVRNNDPNGLNYESGMLRSKTVIKYGYLEARVKMPRALGVWPAFWLNAEVPPWPPEIDIFEFVNNGVEDKVNMLHTGVINHVAQGSTLLYADPSFNTQWTYWTAPFNFPDDFHVVALLWDATSAATYVDGKMIVKRGYKWVHDDGTDAGFAHVLLNLAIGGQWAGRHGIDDAAFPQALEIDYVRVYQNEMNVGQSTTGSDLCPASGGC